MAAPTYEDANIMLQVMRWGAERGIEKAFSFMWSDKYEGEFATFQEKYPAGSKQDRYLSQICGQYEIIAAFWVNGLLNEKLISDMWPVTIIWERVKGYALGIRELTGEPMIYEHFEALAKKFSN